MPLGCIFRSRRGFDIALVGLDYILKTKPTAGSAATALCLAAPHHLPLPGRSGRGHWDGPVGAGGRPARSPRGYVSTRSTNLELGERAQASCLRVDERLYWRRAS